MPKKHPPRVSIFRIYGLLTGAILLCVVLFVLFYSSGGAQILLVEQAALEQAALDALPTPTPTPEPAPVSTAGRLFAFQENGLWGYKNAAGEVAILPQFSSAEDFGAEDDLAFAAQDGLYGLINRSGQWVAQPAWSAFLPFSEGRAAVESGEKWGFVDESGVLVIGYNFREVGSFSCGRAMARTASSYGYIDPLGNMAVSEKFRYAGQFENDMAFAGVGDSNYIVNKAGDPQYTLDPGVTGTVYSEGLALVQNSGTFYFINQYARQAFSGEYEDALSFSGGYAAVKSGGLWGFINSSGEQVVAPQYAQAESFSEGLAAVQDESGMWAYINTSGVLRTDFVYAEAGPFFDGYAKVRRGESWLLLDPEGQEVFLYGAPLATAEGPQSSPSPSLATSPSPTPAASPSPSSAAGSAAEEGQESSPQE